MTNKLPTALTIAGSDSCAGAGIQADLKTFAALGVYGMSAITSVTAQNSRQVTGIRDLPPEFVALQITTVLRDMPADAIKTGMLSSPQIVKAVVDTLAVFKPSNLVVDPVMVSTSGHILLSNQAQEICVKSLFPLARVVTPNLAEASVLVGYPVDNLEKMRHAARKIYDMGPRAVVVKGGHLHGPACDLLFDGGTFVEFEGKRIDTSHTHGTGCTFASAVAAGLARGLALAEAVQAAKAFVADCIQNSLALGHGRGPLHHFAALYRESQRNYF